MHGSTRMVANTLFDHTDKVLHQLKGHELLCLNLIDRNNAIAAFTDNPNSLAHYNIHYLENLLSHYVSMVEYSIDAKETLKHLLHPVQPLIIPGATSP